VTSTETLPEVLTAIEDDPDIYLLIETIYSMDSRFTLANVAETAEEALESADLRSGYLRARSGPGGTVDRP
jgi:hypothetical protein